MDRREERRSVRVKPTCCAIPSMKTKITITKRIPIFHFYAFTTLTAIAKCVPCSCPYQAFKDVGKGSLCCYDDIKLSSLVVI